MKLAAILMLTVGCAAETEAAPSMLDCGSEVPTITWETFGDGFVTTHCQGCHASTTLDRRGAPPEVVFDTQIDTLARARQILDAAATDAPRMPPAGGPTDDDRERLAIWLTCFADE